MGKGTKDTAMIVVFYPDRGFLELKTIG